jgi:hypothetical protein
MKAAKASSSGSESLRAPGPKVPLATERATRVAAVAVHPASSAQATRVERLLIRGSLVGSSVGSAPCGRF